MGLRRDAKGAQDSPGQGEQQTRGVSGWQSGRHRWGAPGSLHTQETSILQRRRAPGGSQPPTPAPAESDFIFPGLKQRQKIACLLQMPSLKPKDFAMRI